LWLYPTNLPQEEDCLFRRDTMAGRHLNAFRRNLLPTYSEQESMATEKKEGKLQGQKERQALR